MCGSWERVKDNEMNRTKILSLICGVTLLAAGCAADVQAPEVGVTSQELTLAECTEQRDACFAVWGLLGILTCNAQYTTCAATADDGLPAEVSAAIAAATACQADRDACILDAQSPLDLAVCGEAHAICVADIVDVQLPTIVGDTAACVDTGVACILDSGSAGDLVGCAEGLSNCAIDAASNVIDDVAPGVTDVIDATLACNEDGAACILSATTPAELTECGEQQALCIAGVLDTVLPVPASDALSCTEEAADCTIEARSFADLGACADGLASCTADLVSGVVDCSAQFTQCLFANPLFGFFTCPGEYQTCLAGDD
jgi:hypothetical protein